MANSVKVHVVHAATKTPPWFSVQLSDSTTDSIEVRICGDEDTGNENTPIELLEIYICAINVFKLMTERERRGLNPTKSNL